MDEQTPFDMVGGEERVRALTETFYDVMDSDPGATHVRSLHASSLASSREKLYLFLCGWLGGPQYYVEKYGHPMLRRRHMPFAVDERAKDEWLHCMFIALEKSEIDPDLGRRLHGAFTRLAEHMINT